MKQQRSGRAHRRSLGMASSLLLSLALGCATASAQTQGGTTPSGKAYVHGQPIEAFGGYGGGARIPEPVVPSGVASDLVCGRGQVGTARWPASESQAGRGTRPR